MVGYERIGEVSADELMSLQAQIENAAWKVTETEKRKYSTWSTEMAGYSRAFFLRIPPGGYVHRHSDTGETKTLHVVIETNSEAVSVMYEPEKTEYHLEEGGIYKVDRSLEHESFNHGKTDRTHLLLEMR